MWQLKMGKRNQRFTIMINMKLLGVDFLRLSQFKTIMKRKYVHD